jgi:HK97 family phage portal protein
MGIISRIGRALRNRPEQEVRSAIGFSAGFGIGWSGAGAPGMTYTGALLAENVATITAAVQLISSTIGSLPAFVYKRDDTGRTEAPHHPVAALIKAPNERQTWPDFMEWLTSQFLLRGNALALIETDGNGQAVRLIPIPWEHVIPVLLDNRRLAFDILQLGPWGGTGLPRRVLDTEVLHVRDRSDDGYLGRSRLSRAPKVIQAALNLQEFSTSIWDNAATPSLAITHPGRLNAEAKIFLQEEFNSLYAGTRNARRSLLLDEGMSAVPLSVSPEDAQTIESRRLSREECAALMGVPPPLVGIWDHSSFTNSATASSWMGTFTILPIVRKIEAEFLRTVFADPAGPFHLEMDMSALMRGDSTAQQASNVANVTAGVMTINEARADLGLNPLPTTAPPLDGELPGVLP